ncbi:MAG TPA: D-cysteine desulfhydrase family protein [Pirellulales bacterium]|nr:D-cysteine desulfhydrase family protein [Pirellulales bacterium]
MPATRQAISISDLRRAVERLPRVALAHLPTPLEELPRFSAAIDGPPVWIKRDDCTGLAFGGNKARHNEFLLGHALEQRAEMLVWGAGVQSNNCRQTAAACAKLGLPCHLMLGSGGHAVDVQGNLLLDYLLGATVEIVDLPLGPELYERIAAKADALRAEGKRVYCWENDVVKPRAAASYALCFAEIVEQCQREGISPSAIYVSSAGSTAAGLLLGKAALGSEIAIRIVAPLRWPWDHATDLAHTANQTAELIGLPPLVEPSDVITTLDYIAPGYGIISPAGHEAFDLLARTEGILVDPVYTSKALAALVDDARGRRLPADRPVVFVHTGGTPALFAYRDQLVASTPGTKFATS